MAILCNSEIVNQLPPTNFRSINFVCAPESHSSGKHKKSNLSLTAMASEESSVKAVHSVPDNLIKLLFVEMGVGYDQHGILRQLQCEHVGMQFPQIRFRHSGNIPGVLFGEMKLQIKLGVPRSLQHILDIQKIKSVFPYGVISNVEVVNSALICSSGMLVEEMGDKNQDCYIVNAAVYVGY